MIEDMGKTYKLVNSNLDRLEFKASIYASITMTTHHYNLDRLEPPQPTKTKIWRVLSNPTKGVYKRERPPCNEPILSRKKSKVNTNTMTPTNQGVIF